MEGAEAEKDSERLLPLRLGETLVEFDVSILFDSISATLVWRKEGSEGRWE